VPKADTRLLDWINREIRKEDGEPAGEADDKRSGAQALGIIAECQEVLMPFAICITGAWKVKVEIHRRESLFRQSFNGCEQGEESLCAKLNWRFVETRNGLGNFDTRQGNALCTESKTMRTSMSGCAHPDHCFVFQSGAEI